MKSVEVREQMAQAVRLDLVGPVSGPAPGLRPTRPSVQIEFKTAIATRLLRHAQSEVPHPRRKSVCPPYDPAAFQHEHALRPRAGVVEDDRLIGQPHSLRCIEQTPPIPSPNIRVRYVMAALGHAQTNPLDVQFGIAQRDVDQQGPVARSFCLTHERQCAMAGESALQNETVAAAKQRPAAEYRLAGSRDRRARRLHGVECPGNGVRIDDAGQSFESDRGSQGAFARAIRTGDQRQARHFRRRLTPVRAARCGAIRAAAQGLTGSRTVCHWAIPQRSAQPHRRIPPDDQPPGPPDGRSNRLVRQLGQTRRSGYWRGPSMSVSRIPACTLALAWKGTV